MGESADIKRNQASKPAEKAGIIPVAGHIPVMLDEVLRGLSVCSGGNYLDATVGGGGHATAILTASAPDGQLLALDRDPEAVARSKAFLQHFGDRVQVMHASYVKLEDLATDAGLIPLDGVLFDLGFSSWQIDDPDRGFSFQHDGPLDMRFDPDGDALTASELVNDLAEFELVHVIRQYGEEIHARRIARAIVNARPVMSTAHLAQVIAAEVGRSKRGIHPATRTFQALRIAVNRELEILKTALPQAVAVLRPGGRLAAITFHSLEDRIVKHFFKQEQRGCICPPEAPVCTCGRHPSLRIITRKPIRPSPEEIAKNTRCRSAKLRIAEKLDVVDDKRGTK